MGSRCLYTKKKKKVSLYCGLNYSLSNLGLKFVVVDIFSYSNKQPFVALLKNRIGFISLVYLPSKVFFGAVLRLFFKKPHLTNFRKNGYTLSLALFKAGDSICSIFLSMTTRKPWGLAAGGFCKVLYMTNCMQFLVIKLPSGVEKKISTAYFGVLGRLSNLRHSKEVLGSAGQSSALGIKPSVRGIAMNPVDHPHGGRTNTVKPEVSPWGWVTKHRH